MTSPILAIRSLALVRRLCRRYSTLNFSSSFSSLSSSLSSSSYISLLIFDFFAFFRVPGEYWRHCARSSTAPETFRGSFLLLRPFPSSFPLPSFLLSPSPSSRIKLMLVGQDNIGKTSIVNQLARKWQQDTLQGASPTSMEKPLTSGSPISTDGKPFSFPFTSLHLYLYVYPLFILLSLNGPSFSLPPFLFSSPHLFLRYQSPPLCLHPSSGREGREEGCRCRCRRNCQKV